MRKIWVFAIGVLICLTAAGGLAAPADGDSNGDQNDQPMTRMMKTVDGYLYLPLSYFMKGVGYGDRKYYGQEDGKAWLNVIGTRVEFRVPGEEDDPPGREFFQLTINGKTIDINRAVALPGDGHDPYVLGAVLAKAVGYIQKGSGLTMASVRYESDPKALTPGDLMVRSRNGGDLAAVSYTHL
ncbi:MAG: hypothetical protein N3A57_03870, partial [Negativicutes bacterium]|nr:hypothetical protein [Negativicutes bacterium]